MTIKSKWKLLESIVSIDNRWIELTGEYLLDEEGQRLTYWRVKRADSVIVIPIYRNKLILLKPSYRHGIEEFTYDFPGGRHEDALTHQETAYKILQRELHIFQNDVEKLTSINKDGWIVDSSFSSQRVFSFEAIIRSSSILYFDLIGIMESTDTEGVDKVFSKLCYMQCHCTLLEWILRQNS